MLGGVGGCLRLRSGDGHVGGGGRRSRTCVIYLIGVAGRVCAGHMEARRGLRGGDVAVRTAVLHGGVVVPHIDLVTWLPEEVAACKVLVPVHRGARQRSMLGCRIGTNTGKRDECRGCFSGSASLVAVFGVMGTGAAGRDGEHSCRQDVEIEIICFHCH